MPRSITAGMITASVAEHLRAVLLAKLEYSSGNVNAHTGAGSLTFNGDTYTGVGTLGKVSSVEETAELQSNKLGLSIAATENAQVSRALGEHYQGRAATLFLGLLNASYQLISDPITLFKGRMDNQVITLGRTPGIEVTIESIMADWERPGIRRYNAADHKIYFPQDKGLDYVEQAVEKEIYWGKPEPPER